MTGDTTNDTGSDAIHEDNNFTGHFLIAMPSLDDGFFNQAVTYICEHDASGCFGVIINQQTTVTLKEIIEQMGIKAGELYDEEQPIYIGGPVDQGRGFILHRPVGNWQSSLQVTDNVALTTSKDILEALADGNGPEDNIVALGYAGWSAGQLEDEMASNTWLNCPAEEQIIFETPVTERWKAAAQLIGIDLSLLSNDAGHA